MSDDELYNFEEFTEEDYEEFTRQLIDRFVSEGVMEMIGIDEQGEFIYKMTPLMMELYPEVYDEYMSTTNSIVQELWEKELIDVVIKDDGEFGIFLNENTMNYKEYDLDEDQLLMIEEIIRMMA